MHETGIIRLDPTGPVGTRLTPLELDATDFQSELPEQTWHIYFSDEALGLTVGVWTTTSMQEAFGPYPGDEFMHILEGQVKILDAEGIAVTVHEGETFMVQNGTPVSWKQDGFCRKFFMTYLSPTAPTPKQKTAQNGIKLLREAELISHYQLSKNSAGIEQKNAEVFKNDTGNLTAGMWETEAFDTDMAPFPNHEFAQMISGSLTIAEEDGSVHKFSSGDCFFIPAGTVCAWKASEPFRKFYCTLTPNATF